MPVQRRQYLYLWLFFFTTEAPLNCPEEVADLSSHETRWLICGSYFILICIVKTLSNLYPFYMFMWCVTFKLIRYYSLLFIFINFGTTDLFFMQLKKMYCILYIGYSVYLWVQSQKFLALSYIQHSKWKPYLPPRNPVAAAQESSVHWDATKTAEHAFLYTAIREWLE